MNRRKETSVFRIASASALLAFAVVTTLVLANSRSDTPPPVGLENSSKIFGVTKESAGAVTVTLTPKKHVEGQLFVEIAVTTHTINDLEKYDLKKIATLDFTEQSIAPTSAPALRGHHNSGQLVFPLAAMPGAFAIKLHGLDQPVLRVLSWP